MGFGGTVERVTALTSLQHCLAVPFVSQLESCDRIWHSDRVKDEQHRFEPPYFYVQVLPVSLTDYFAEVFGDGTEARGSTKDLFIAPYTTTPLPHRTLNFADARSVIFLLAQNRSEDYVSEGAPNWTATTVEAAAVSLTFCAVDRETAGDRPAVTSD